MVQNRESTITQARPNSRRWQQKNYGSAKNVLQLHHPLTQSTLGWSVINKDKEWTDGWTERVSSATFNWQLQSLHRLVDSATREVSAMFGTSTQNGFIVNKMDECKYCMVVYHIRRNADQLFYLIGILKKMHCREHPSVRKSRRPTPSFMPR